LKTSSILILGVVGFGAYEYFKLKGTANAVRGLQYTGPRVKLGKFSLLSGLQMEITLDFINNSSEDISIEYFTGTVIYSGSTLANFTFNANGQKQGIKARTTTSVPFTVVLKTLTAMGVVAKIADAVAGKSSLNTVITVKGSFYAAGIDVPVLFDYDVKTGTLVSVNGGRVAGNLN